MKSVTDNLIVKSVSGKLSIKTITFIISYILDNPNTKFNILLILAGTCKKLRYSISNLSSLNLSNSLDLYTLFNYSFRNLSSLNLSNNVDPYRLFNYRFRNLSQLKHLDLSGIICTKREISHVQRAMIISSLIHLKSFKYNDNDPRLLRLCLQNLPNLESLSLSDVDIGKYGDILSPIFRRLTCLTTLDLSSTIGGDYYHDRDMHNRGMKKILRALPSSITTFIFSSNTIHHARVKLAGKIIHKPLKNDEMRAVADGLSRLTNLTTLDLSWTCINTRFMKVLAPALCGLTQLKTLHLDHIHDSYIEGEGEIFILVANVIKVIPQLEILTLGENYIKTNMTELCSAFRNLDKLKKLELKYIHSDSVSFSSIITALPYMTSLTYLGLEMTGCNAMHIPLLWNALSNHTTLTSLDLSSNNIGDQYNTEPHFEYLPPIPNLSHLNLSYNNFNRNDMKIILDAQTELKTLNFDRNVIDMEGFTFLIPSFETMSQLRSLSISSKFYSNQLNYEVLSHLTSLKLNR